VEFYSTTRAVGRDKTQSAINTLAATFLGSFPRCSAIFLDVKGVVHRDVAGLAKWAGREADHILLRSRSHEDPPQWRPAHTINLTGDICEANCNIINRNKTIMILFFANSVSHAEEIAARLHLAGIPSASVSGETPTVARRHFLNGFQRGEIRVLCNHSVLTTGFDAPKTDMVLIARQVFSPVRYMQMVGRGMRGEKNGGTARCRLVTVLDNLRQFQDKHPYHFCAKYFAQSAAKSLEP
jgi:superfamily II DNA or RNA helicase